MEHLDARAIGTDLLRQVHALLPELRKDNTKHGFYADPEYITRYLAVVKALYENRRYSWSEYVFLAVSTIEAAQERKLMDGAFKAELAPIEAAMEEIRREHGLGPNEDFYLNHAPAEYRELNEKWDWVLEKHFLDSLHSFGLKDLAVLYENDRGKFDLARERGRRAVHHKDELVHALRDIVVRYEEEARRAATIGAHAAAVTLLGAGVEGLLLLRCLRSKNKAIRVAKALPKRNRPRQPNDPLTWRFEQLIGVCLHAKWLPKIDTGVAVYESGGLANMLREMRNHVHPARRAKERPWCEAEERDYADARSIYRLLLPILTGQLRVHRRSPGERTDINA